MNKTENDENWRKSFPIKLGVEGRDDYYMKCADGEITTWEEYHETCRKYLENPEEFDRINFGDQ